LHPARLLAQDPSFFPVNELREGMTGVGRTVFHGTTIEEFQVEILGVLKNAAPRQDMILGRLSGGPLAETGVMQGMSGSPIYIDGRLVGAVAFAFNTSTDAIAGIQPISQMVSILGSPEAPSAPVPVERGALPAESPREYVTRVMTGLMAGDAVPSPLSALVPVANPEVAAMQSAGLRPIRTPLFVSGAPALAVGEFAGIFESYGFTAVQGGGAGSAASVLQSDAVPIEPGSSINAELVRGDISMSANGTVTYVDGDKVYAFGHPFQSTGPTDLPMSPGYVLSLVPTRTTSFKIAVPLDVVGSFQQDRSTGILGRLGGAAKMVPVRVDVETSRNGIERYEYEVVGDRFLMPLLMNFTLFSLIQATERSLGESTLEVSGTIHLQNGQEIAVGSAFAGDFNTPVQATVATVAPITYLLSGTFESLAIESVNLNVKSTDQRRSARLDSVRIDRTEARAGESVNLEARLRTPDGDEIIERHTIPIPSGLTPGRVQLLVGDGLSVTASDIRRAPAAPPHDIQQIIRELNGLRRMDRLYVKILSSNPGVVISGEELPSLPPSMIAMIDTARASDSHTSGTRNSPVRELELGPSDYVVQGMQSLNLTIIP
jgi:hypothetical protein